LQCTYAVCITALFAALVNEKTMKIEAIEKFLKNWRADAFKVYTEGAAKWNKMRADVRSLRDQEKSKRQKSYWATQLENDMVSFEDHLNLWYIDGGRNSFSGEKRPKPEPSVLLAESSPRFVELCNELNEYAKANTDSFMHIITEKMGEIDAILDREVDRKRKALITRVEKKAGKIIDASFLRVGDDGEINGMITGEKGDVAVNTITAGGYNIQCLHYRLLVKNLK
jgi:hypothetical protein